jgi:PAS domain S-box-containing protein
VAHALPTLPWLARFRGRTALQRYAAAAIVVVIGAVAASLMRPQFDFGLLPPFLAAVAISAWFGGFGPGLLTGVLSIVAIDLFLSGPIGQFALAGNELPRFAAFLLTAALIAALSASQQRVEAALRVSEQRFRSIVDVANEGVWLLGPAGGTVYANQRLAAILGVDGDVLARRSLWDFVFADDVDALRERFARALRERLDSFEFRLKRGDGATAHVLIATSPVEDAGGVAGVVALITDISERQRAARDLARANERFVLAADAVQALIYDWNPASDYVEWSPGLAAVVGWRPDEAPPSDAWWTDQIHPADRERLRRTPRPERLARDRFSNEYRVRHRDGHWVNVWDQGRVVHDAAGRPIRVVGSTIDITARKAAEEALHLLANAGQMLSSGLDLDMTLQRAAALPLGALADWCAVDLIGPDGAPRQASLAVGDAGRAIVAPPPDFVARAVAAGTAFLASETSLAVADVARCGDAERLLAAAHASALLTLPLAARDVCFGAMTLARARGADPWHERDVALAQELARRAALAIDNARLHREAQEAEARYHGLFAGATDGILLIDRRGRFVDANPAAGRLLGYDHDALLAASIADVLADGDIWREAADELGRSGAWRGEFELRRKNGATVPVEAWIDAVSLQAELVYVAVVRDMAERRALERGQEEFVAAAAHDLKNPLAAIRGQAQLLRRRLRKGEPLSPERLEQGIEGIDAAAERMAGLIDELADIARIRSGAPLEMRPAPVDLVDLVLQTAAIYRRASERHEIVVDAGPEPVVGRWDGPRLERVLGNLLGNAVKYSPNGGRIVIRVGREADAAGPLATLSVADQGVGIPPADLPCVFDRFHRGGNVGTIAGDGIGLAAARQIVEAHGGAISVESVEGAGSTFTIRLPLDCPPVPTAKTAANARG